MNRRIDTFYEVLDVSLPVFDDYDRSNFDDASIRYANSKTLRFVTDEFIQACRRDRTNIERFFEALRQMNTEDARALLYSKNLMDGRGVDNIGLDDDDYKNSLVSYFQDHPEPLIEFNHIIEYKINNLLPESYLDWFKDNLRHSLFLAYLLRDYIQYNAYKGRDELINAVADILRYDTHEFISLWRNNIPKYERRISPFGDFQAKHIVCVKARYFKNCLDITKDAKWIDATNTEQIEWIYEYLRAKNPQQIILDRVFIPKNIEEKYELILASLDVLSNVENADIGTKKNKGFSERSYTLYSMKKAWDGQKHYSKKKQVENGSIKIYKKNQDKLKAIMKQKGSTANQVINDSIEQMYERLIVEKTNA